MASANLREKDDSSSTAIGGFVGGAILGLRCAWSLGMGSGSLGGLLTCAPDRSLPHVIGYGATAAVLLGVFNYTGGSLAGFREDQKEDDFDRKEFLRKNRRRPIDETIDELGERRGMFQGGLFVARRRLVPH